MVVIVVQAHQTTGRQAVVERLRLGVTEQLLLVVMVAQVQRLPIQDLP